MFAGGGLDLFDIVLRMDGLAGFAEEFANRLELPIPVVKVPVLKLERIVASNRKKDQLVLSALEDALKAIKANGRTEQAP